MKLQSCCEFQMDLELLLSSLSLSGGGDNFHFWEVMWIKVRLVYGIVMHRRIRDLRSLFQLKMTSRYSQTKFLRHMYYYS